jgi:hypothetical protein
MPGLKGNARNGLGGKNPLRRWLATAIPDKNRYLVARLVEGAHVFRRGQESSRE